MARWQENFDFYEARAEEGRAFIAVDLAARQHAPVESHPVRLQFRVKMKNPRPDGLRSDAEADALFALEDKLVEVVQTKLDGLYVARAVAYGFSEFFFYVGPQHLQVGAELFKDVPDYELEYFAEADAKWERYAELYPDPWSFQTIMNRRLLAQLTEAGDRFELPRVIDHFAYFATRPQALAAKKDLEAADFAVDEPAAPKEGTETWGLAFHRDETLADGAPDEFVAEVLDLLEPHEGDYDGWGCPVQAKSALN